MKNLWTDNTTLGGDFATIIYRAQLLGFNAVRLPFRFSDLNMQPKNWTFPCTPQRYADIKVDLAPEPEESGYLNYMTLSCTCKEPAPLHAFKAGLGILLHLHH